MPLPWFVIAAALGVEPIPVEPVVPDQAEYARLTQELQSLAERNAWSGAERTFKKLEATGWPPSYEDLTIGAHSARAVGDVASTRSRLLAAKTLREDKDVFDSLWELDQNYASVNLHCDPGSGWELSAQERPFDPDQVRAMEFAVAAIDTNCEFRGYLPKGAYTFAERTFTVIPGVTAIDMDMRGLQAPKKRKRDKKKQPSAEDPPQP
jgi:hypothetical protein